MTQQHSRDWVGEIADRVVAEADRRAPGRPVVCASGISPSGPVHLGNLRELLVPHFVADEIRRRGVPCTHLLSWDDYDRLRKVPAGFADSYQDHIGRPLSGVPDPCDRHASWAEHFKEPFRTALAELGVEVVERSQTQEYASGTYRQSVLRAMRDRDRIDAVLARYRTLQTASGEGEPAHGVYSPYRPYCAHCGRDTTTVVDYDDATTVLAYTCSYGHAGSYELSGTTSGKLVWKVDWPMRWAHEGVTFEAGGVDHSSPGSSFAVGAELVRDVFGAEPPVYVGYSFVGTTGAAKMSGSAGLAPTPADALAVLEAPVLRWLYARRKPSQSITVNFGQDLLRVYDEWDVLGRRVAAGTEPAGAVATWNRSRATAATVLPSTPRPLPFRTLASVVDLVGGDEEQMTRVFRELTRDDPMTDLGALRPRLDKAATWLERYVPADERTTVLSAPNVARLATLTPQEREAIELLRAGLDDHWSPDGLTTLVYGVPKRQQGLPEDAAPTAELKSAQRAFFALLYELLVGRGTGPRLPTLLLSVGRERIGELLKV